MNAIHIEGLRKTYENGFEALKGIDLEVEQGDFFALLGPNGAGKTTAIGIMTSLVRKSSGKVVIFGHDIDHEFEQAKACLGVVPQEINCNLFETCRQILVHQAGYYGVPRREANQRCERYLKELGLWEKRDTVSRALSGGMKRRLMIARSLVHQPRLLILDEPTAGVDIELRRTMWDFLREINREGTTIILTTHYLEEAEQLCQNLAIIDHGEIQERSDMRSLLRRLAMQSYIIELGEPLEDVPESDHFRPVLSDPSTLEVSLNRETSLNELFGWLNQHGLVVSSLRPRANRLEELFLQLVSKKPA